MTEEQRHELVLDFTTYVRMANESYHKKAERKAFYWRAVGIMDCFYTLKIEELISEEMLENLNYVKEELKI